MFMFEQLDHTDKFEQLGQHGGAEGSESSLSLETAAETHGLMLYGVDLTWKPV